jgi:hypothetical protein
MKKALLTFALAAFAFTASAQWVMGGQIGFGHNGAHNDTYTAGSTSTTAVAVQPKLGYNLNENWQIGATIVVGYDYTRNYTMNEDSYNSTGNLQFGISPYARYTYGIWKKWNLFVEGSFVFGMSPETTTHTYANGNEVGTGVKNGDDVTMLRIGIVPGLNCKLSDSFSLDLYLDVASLSWMMINTTGFDTHDFSFGANFDSRTITDYLNNFRIGFNYHF